ncbi:MAG: flagellar filament outer layer protein FlaA, partial [Armatimonadota bacterium]|nr:flagellar filament outer layer protein FlaA [Armatimonadota bacterium]
MLRAILSVITLLPAAVCVATPAAPAPTESETLLLSDPGLPDEWKTWQWNKTPVALSPDQDFPAAVAAGEGAVRRSLCLRIRWPDDQYRSLLLEPAAPQEPIPYQVREVGVWVKGAGSAHLLDVRFTDANGKEARLPLGALNFEEWRRLSAAVPAEWAQPLTLRSLSISTGAPRRAGTTPIYLGPLEAHINAGAPLAATEEGARLTLKADAPDGILPDEPRARLYLSVRWWRAGRHRLQVRHTLVNWEGRTQKLTPISAEFAWNWSRKVEIPTPAYGPYWYRAEVRDDAGRVLKTE